MTSSSQSMSDARKMNADAVALFKEKRYNDAIVLQEKCVAIYERENGKDDPKNHIVVKNLAMMYRDMGNFTKAEPLFQRALAMREKKFGPSSPEATASVLDLAWTYWGLHDVDRGGAMLQRHIDIRIKAIGASTPEIGALTNRLGVFYADNAAYDRAEAEYKKALAIYEAAEGPNHPDVIYMLRNIGGFYRGRGDLVRAESFLQRAMKILETSQQNDIKLVADAQNGLASLYAEMGDYIRAELLLQRAIDATEKLSAEPTEELASYLLNLGTCYVRSGKREKAKLLYERALAIDEKVMGPKRTELGFVNQHLGEFYSTDNDLDKAEKMLRRSLEIFQNGLGNKHPFVANVLNDLAVLHEKRAEPDKADEYFTRAISIYEDTAPDHLNLAAAFNNRALMNLRRGNSGLALRDFAKSAAINEKNISSVLSIGSERQKQLFLNKAEIRADTFEIVYFSTKSPWGKDFARLAFTTILQRKGRALDAMTDQIALLRSRSNPEVQTLLDKLQGARRSLSNLQLAAVEAEQPQPTPKLSGDASEPMVAPISRKEKLAALEREVEQLEAEIGRKSSAFRDQIQPVDLAAVQKAIPADAALVEIFVFRPFEFAAKGEINAGKPRYAAFIARNAGDPQVFDLGETTAIDALVEKTRAELSPEECFAQKNSAGEDSAKCLRLREAMNVGRLIGKAVIDPIRSALGNADHIIISPDGALNLVPFAAMVDENGKFLAERYTITYVTNGRDLLGLRSNDHKPNAPLLVGDPLYNLEGKSGGSQATFKRDSDFRSLDFAKINFPPLPGTAKELIAISQLVPDARSLTGKTATEQAVKSVSRPRILHIATHGYFLSDRSMDSGEGRQLVLERPKNTPSIDTENPMLRSGLILAGVNQRSSGGQEDGVLTAVEAAGLDLFGTKLVVLSACETGVGEVKSGESVYGLRRALVLAGSESQIMSLWKVSDEGTKELMSGYYQNLRRGEGRSAALRKIQMGMIKGSTFSHPYYWASFIQSGASTPIQP